MHRRFVATAKTALVAVGFPRDDGGIIRPVSNTGPMPAARRRAAPIPTLPPHLEAALGVIDAVQSLGELVDVAEILATLARRLTEIVMRAHASYRSSTCAAARC